ncbi:MAG: hypothetical protein WDN45_06720 [Caulobacteraceae bacterium]
MRLSSQWAPLHGPIIGFIVAEISINVLALTRPGWGRLNAGLSLAKNLTGCVILGLVLKGGYLVEGRGAGPVGPCPGDDHPGGSTEA